MPLSLRERLTMVMPLSVFYRQRIAQEARTGEPELAVLTELVPRGGIAVDVGANVGFFAYALADIADRVLAFEPNPDYAFFARWMLRDRAEVHEVALSDASGRGTLYVPLLESAIQGQALSDYPRLRCQCRSRARASLRTRHQGPSIMGFEDEVEQSFGRPRRQCDGRAKQTYDLTSSIVPRGTSFHRWVELDFPPIAFDPAQISSCCDFPGPSELGAVNPHAVHDHGQPTRQRHDRLFHPAIPGDLHRPGLDPGPFRRTHQHALGRFVEHHPHHLV